MFTLYVLIFWLSFRVFLWHTSQSGGADGTRMIDITATVALGVPLAYSCVGFLWTLSYLPLQFWMFLDIDLRKDLVCAD